MTVTGRRQRGFALIASLLILVVLTLISLAMSRSFWLEAGMAGNLREKSRAVNAAQSALRYGEWWLTQNNATSGATCSAGHGGTPQVCTNPVVTAGSNAAILPWASWVDYTPPNMTVNTSGGANTYYGNPGFYIQYIGPDTSNTKSIYQITAFGYGGNQNAVAVVQGTYGVGTGVTNLGGL